MHNVVFFLILNSYIFEYTKALHDSYFAHSQKFNILFKPHSPLAYLIKMY